MSKKKHSSAKNAPAKNAPAKKNASARPSRPPKWGILVAGLFAFLIVSAALVVMEKIGVKSDLIRTGVVMVLAVTAGLAARPLTMALQKRIDSD